MSLQSVAKLKSQFEDLLPHTALLGPENTREVLRTIAELNGILRVYGGR